MFSKPIREFMSTRITTVPSDQNLRTAIHHMARANVGAIIVVEDGKPVGIFTERDLLKRVVAKNVHIDGLTVGQVMTPKIISFPPDTPLLEVVKKMYTMAIRHMAIMEGGKVIGVFSLRDCLRLMLVPQ